MQEILRLLNKSGQIGGKVNNRWVFKKDSEEFALVEKELKLYMDAPDHKDYMKNFEKKHKPPQIIVKTLTGLSLTFEVNDTMLVSELKSLISKKDGARVEQRLEYQSRQLEDSRTLSDYNIGHQSTLYELGRKLGGMRPAQPTEDSSLCLIDADALTTTMTRRRLLHQSFQVDRVN